MSEAIIGQENGITFIQCSRVSASKNKMKSIVKDKQDVEWKITMSKEEFDRQKDSYVVDVYDNQKVKVKKYIKSFLKFVKEIS